MIDSVDIETCKYCGRCVLAGPACCYDLAIEMLGKTLDELKWHRKLQGKNAKEISELKEKIKSLTPKDDGHKWLPSIKNEHPWMTHYYCKICNVKCFSW